MRSGWLGERISARSKVARIHAVRGGLVETVANVYDGCDGSKREIIGFDVVMWAS